MCGGARGDGNNNIPEDVIQRAVAKYMHQHRIQPALPGQRNAVPLAEAQALIQQRDDEHQVQVQEMEPR